MISAFLTGFLLGASLILAIGAQNTFVLRQGILGQHVFYVALFCALSDAVLIIIGITSISFFFNSFIDQFTELLFGLSALWLFGYGILRLKGIFKSDEMINFEAAKQKSLFSTILVAAFVTFMNPHVYLDTMILIGAVSQQFNGYYKIAFGLGSCLSSFIFFFSLAFGSKLLSNLMIKPFSWKILDSIVALIMFFLAFKLASSGNWL